MPWKVESRNGRYAVVKKGTGKLVAMHNNAAGAEAQVRALYANYNPQGPKVKKSRTAAAYRARNAATRRIQAKAPKEDESTTNRAYLGSSIGGKSASYIASTGTSTPKTSERVVSGKAPPAFAQARAWARQQASKK